MFVSQIRCASPAVSDRDDALDGIRAIAIVFVVMYHVSIRRIPGGWIGVDLFFVLSGFLITNIVTKEVDATGRFDLWRFCCRRSLRLWPAYVVLLATMFAVASLERGSAITQDSLLYAASFTMNWGRAFKATTGGALGHCWSLAVEQQFYLAWPLILVALPARRRVAATAMLVMTVFGWRCWLAMGGASIDRTYNGLDTHADALLIGALLALVDRRPPCRPDGQGRRAMLAAGSALLVVAGLAASQLLVLDRLATQTIGMTLASIAGAGLIACARQPGWLRTALSWSPMAVVGRLSYGIYLWHYPAIVLGYDHFRGPWTLVPVTMSVGTALLSHRFVERPFLEAGRRWFSRSRTGGVRLIQTLA